MLIDDTVGIGLPFRDVASRGNEARKGLDVRFCTGPHLPCSIVLETHFPSGWRNAPRRLYSAL